MRPIKLFGVTAVLAIAVAAIGGLGTASATELYKRTASGIETLKSGTEVKASLSGSTTFTTTSGTSLDTCTGGEEGSKTSNTGSSTETVRWIIVVFAWTGCTEPTETKVLGEGETHWISGTTDDTVTFRNIIILINTTIFGATCEYTAGESLDVGTMVGASTSTGSATMAINTVLPAKNSFFCPDARWIANYKITSPVGLVTEAS